MAQTAVAFLVALVLLCGADALKAPRTWEPVVSLRQRGGHHLSARPQLVALLGRWRPRVAHEVAVGVESAREVAQAT